MDCGSAAVGNLRFGHEHSAYFVEGHQTGSNTTAPQPPIPFQSGFDLKTLRTRGSLEDCWRCHPMSAASRSTSKARQQFGFELIAGCWQDSMKLLGHLLLNCLLPAVHCSAEATWKRFEMCCELGSDPQSKRFGSPSRSPRMLLGWQGRCRWCSMVKVAMD